METTGATAQRGPGEALLGLLGDVRPGEWGTALLLALDVFLILTAYYVIKPVREALILSSGPGAAEIKSYTGAVQAALFLLIVPAYGAFARRVNRIRLINAVSAFFISNLVVFYLLSRADLPLGIPFFLWTGIFNVMVIAQFWSFANDLYTPAEGKRLFAVVGIGSATGAITGSGVAGLLVKPIGVFNLMLVSAALLALAVLLANLIHRREARPSGPRPRAGEAEEKLVGSPGTELEFAL